MIARGKDVGRAQLVAERAGRLAVATEKWGEPKAPISRHLDLAGGRLMIWTSDD